MKRSDLEVSKSWAQPLLYVVATQNQGKFIYLGINIPKAGDISGISGLEKYYSGSLTMQELVLIGEN